jgi:hypothetical protein
MSKKYYIQCTEHYAFDFILWWGKERRGYTYDLNDAGLYSEEEARSICNNRWIDVAWSEEDIKTHLSTAVSINHLRKAGLKPAMKSRR